MKRYRSWGRGAGTGFEGRRGVPDLEVGKGTTQCLEGEGGNGAVLQVGKGQTVFCGG